MSTVEEHIAIIECSLKCIRDLLDRKRPRSPTRVRSDIELHIPDWKLHEATVEEFKQWCFEQYDAIVIDVYTPPNEQQKWANIVTDREDDRDRIYNNRRHLIEHFGFKDVLPREYRKRERK